MVSRQSATVVVQPQQWWYSGLSPYRYYSGAGLVLGVIMFVATTVRSSPVCQVNKQRGQTVVKINLYHIVVKHGNKQIKFVDSMI